MHILSGLHSKIVHVFIQSHTDLKIHHNRTHFAQNENKLLETLQTIHHTPN